ncbi:MAG: extracellular solute-binding protein [Rhizobiales bacterium]|nr:extracellular solute-binding protein [Hyphomicrobiales bacterium]
MTDKTKSGMAWTRRDFLTRTALASGAVMGGLSGASPRGLFSPALAADEKTINVLTLGEGIFGDPFVKLAGDFTKATGIKVNNVTMGYNESMQKQAAVFAAQGTDLDVVGVDYMFLKGYAKAGHLAALDPLIPTELADYYSDTPANLKDVWSLDGQTYGLATVGNCQNFIYNEGHLKDVGLEAPDTWDALLSAAQKVVSEEKKRYGFVAGTERLTKAVTVWLPMFWAGGGELFDDKMHPVFASDTGTKSLEFLLELMKTMPPGGGAYTESDEIKALSVGLATLDPTSWVPDSIKNADDATKPNLKTHVAPMGSARRAPVLGGIGLCVSNYSPQKEAAAAFVAWFNSKDVQVGKIVEAGGQPCRISAWEANADAKPWFRSLSENLKVAKSLPQIPEWGQVDGAISAQLTQAFAGEIKPKDALEAAQAGVDEVMKDAGYY